MPARNPARPRTPARVLALFAPALILLLALSVLPAPAGQARFLTVIDGDSLVVELDGRSAEIRLIGIDAPEGRQRYGTQARSHAMGLCYGRELRLEFDRERRDRYGRVLAYVYVGGRMLNEEMVRAGLALALPVEPNTAHAARLKRAEDEARAARRGFWAEGGLEMTPAQWRRQQGR